MRFPFRSVPCAGFLAAVSAVLVVLAVPAAAAPSAVPAGDAAFALVGTGGRAFAARFGLQYFTLEGNYAPGGGTVFHATDPAQDPDPGFSVVREVAKLNVRNDDLGESNAQFQAKLNAHAKALAGWYAKPSFLRGSKPAFAWYRPDAAALAAAESLQIVETIRREKARNPQITGTVWEIGNEPNLFPAILPGEYAALFEAYRRIIKAEDPGAVVAMGSLFLPEPAADLKARLSEELASRMRAELTAAGLYAAVNAAGFFDDLCRDLENTLLSRMLALPAREYLKQVLSATAARPDLVTLHVYGYDDRAPWLDSAGMRALLDTTFAGVEAQLLSQGSTARIWITEFGNIEQDKDEEAVALQTRRLVAAFRGQATVERWFRYKATGADEQFALFSDGGPPLTRLAADASFSPAGGGFACGRLNAVGREYYALSHGGAACNDGPVVDSVRPDPVAVAEGDSLRLRAHATDPEGDALAFVWLRQNGDTVGVGPEVVFRPSYRQAGSEALQLHVVDARGAGTVRPVPAAVANTALRPALANPAGSPLAPGAPVQWAWPGDLADPDYRASTLRATFEFRFDSASAEASHRLEGVTGSAPALLSGPAGPVWVRVRLEDGTGRTSPWSEPRRLLWSGSAAEAAEAPLPAVLTLEPSAGRGARAFRLGLPRESGVVLEVLAVEGSLQGTLYRGRLPAGRHDVTVPGLGSGTGLRIVRLRADGAVRTLLVPVLP